MCVCVCVCVCVSYMIQIMKLEDIVAHVNTLEVVINYVCLSDNNIQDLIISSRLNDLTNCYRHFNVHIMMLYVSAVDPSMKLIFSSYVHLPSINKIFRKFYARMIL